MENRKNNSIWSRVGAYFGIALVILLMGNSNNDPQTFGERIFKPINIGGGHFYYSGLIAVAILMYSFYLLNKNNEKWFYKNGVRRFLLSLILIGIIPSIWEIPLKIYKGFYNDLNAIYIERDKTHVWFNGNNGKHTIDGGISLINCSKDSKSFRMKVRLPSLLANDIEEEYITIEEEFVLFPRESVDFKINQEIKLDGSRYSGYNAKAFEYILFDEDDEAVFKGNLIDYINED